VEERAVPASDVPGESASPTQPFPVRPEPLHPVFGGPWGRTPEERDQCAAQLAGLRQEGIFTPPSLEGTLLYPSYGGGINWGGVAVHPSGVLVAVVNRSPAFVRLLPRERFGSASQEARELADGAITDRRWGAQFTSQDGTPYGMTRRFLASEAGLPCSAPPWGTLTAVDVNGGRLLWERPLGRMPQLVGDPRGEEWGSAAAGGPIVTAGGLVVVGAAMDDVFRAFDLETGELLWRADLPAGPQATPMTYQVGGRQYVVIAAGGHAGLGTTPGDFLIAFALPR
jgi:quinoprotein glucose dehydrogenase